MAKHEDITPLYYSNCLFECIKAKIKNPKIKITYLSPFINKEFCPHFMWSDGEYDYDFGINGYIPFCRVFWFKGCIRRRKLGFNRKWKRAAIKSYYNRKLQKKLRRFDNG